MPNNEHERQEPIGPASPPHSGPRWRALLEARWRERLQEVTELSLAYHTVAGSAPGLDGQEDRQEQRLLGSAVSARRRLADTEEALARLTAGRFGLCEQCGAQIPTGLLGIVPETRYCPRCDGGPAPGRRHATVTSRTAGVGLGAGSRAAGHAGNRAGLAPLSDHPQVDLSEPGN